LKAIEHLNARQRGGHRYSVADVGGGEAAAALAPRFPFGQISNYGPHRLPCSQQVASDLAAYIAGNSSNCEHLSPFFRIIVLSSTSREERGIKTVLKYNSARVESHAPGYVWAKIGAAFLSTEILVAVAPT
jgi:hypothetical protein